MSTPATGTSSMSPSAMTQLCCVRSPDCDAPILPPRGKVTATKMGNKDDNDNEDNNNNTTKMTKAAAATVKTTMKTMAVMVAAAVNFPISYLAIDYFTGMTRTQTRITCILMRSGYLQVYL
jgi:hypothetical protein